MFTLFFDTIYFGYGYTLYVFIHNDILFYSILITILLLINVFFRKLKLRKKVILNLIVGLGLFILFIFPYIKGEKIVNNINCTYELVSKIKEYKNKNGNLPSNLSEIETSPCASKLNIDYEILYKGLIFKNERLKEDSFLITLSLPELGILELKFAGHEKEYYGED